MLSKRADSTCSWPKVRCLGHVNVCARSAAMICSLNIETIDYSKVFTPFYSDETQSATRLIPAPAPPNDSKKSRVEEARRRA